MAGIGVIHYKFKSAIQPESVEFDGHYITVGEVKRLIASKKGLSLEDACAELELSENIKGKAGKVYTDDSQQLPRSASVIVRRLPVQRSKAALAGGRAAAAYAATAAAGGPLVGSSAPIMGDAEQEDFGKDPYEEQIANRQQRMAAEDAVIGQVVAAQEHEWQHSSDPTVLAQARAARGGGRGAGRFQGGRGGPGGRFAPGPHGRPHDTYFCALCGAQGKHWKQDCPQKDAPDLDLRQVRAPAGIPSSMLARDAAGGLLLPNGEVGNVITDQDAFAREMGLAPQPRRNVPALPAPRAASPLPLPGPGAGAAAGGSSRPTSAAARAGAGPADAEDADLLQGLQEEQPQVEEEMEDHGAGLFDDEEDFLAPRVPALSGGLGAGMLEAVAQQQEQQRQQQQKQQQQQGSEQQEGMDEDAPTQQQQRQPPASPAAALPGQRSPAPAAGVRSTTPPSASAAPEPLSTFAELLPYIEDLLPKTWPQDLLEEAFGSDRPLKVAEWGQLTQRLKEQGAGASPKQQQKQRSREEERRREQERGSSRRHGSRHSRSRSRSRSRDGKDKRKRRDRHRSSERSTQPQERRSEREAPPAADTAPQQQEQRPQQQEPAADDLRHQLRKKRAEKQAADAQQQQQQQAAAGGAGEPVARSGEERTPKKQRTEAAAADRPADELMTGASGELQGLLGEPLADLHLSNGGEDAAGHNEGDAEQQDWDAERGASDREGVAPGGGDLEEEQGAQGGGYSAEGGADPMDWGQADDAQEGSQGRQHQQRSSSPRPESGSHGDRNGDKHGSMQQQEEQQEGGSGRSRSGSPTGEGRQRSASRSKGEGGRSPSRRHRRHRSSSRGRKEGERRRSHRDKKDKKERRDKEKKSRHKRRDAGRSRSRSRSPSRRRSSKRSRSRSRSRSPARQQPPGADKPRRPAVERLGSRGSSQPEAAAPGQGDGAAGQAPGKSSRRGGAAKLWQNQLAAGGIGIRK